MKRKNQEKEEKDLQLQLQERNKKESANKDNNSLFMKKYEERISRTAELAPSTGSLYTNYI